MKGAIECLVRKVVRKFQCFVLNLLFLLLIISLVTKGKPTGKVAGKEIRFICVMEGTCFCNIFVNYYFLSWKLSEIILSERVN